MTLSIETKGLAPEEQPMPAIPFPAINWGNDLLPERFWQKCCFCFQE